MMLACDSKYLHEPPATLQESNKLEVSGIIKRLEAVRFQARKRKDSTIDLGDARAYQMIEILSEEISALIEVLKERV